MNCCQTTIRVVSAWVSSLYRFMVLVSLVQVRLMSISELQGMFILLINGYGSLTVNQEENSSSGFC
jgi:hypothetical protein